MYGARALYSELVLISSALVAQWATTWSGTDPDKNMNYFTWSKEENDWIVPEDHYNEEFKYCQ